MNYLAKFCVFALLAATILTSCGNDNDEVTEPEPISDSELTSFNWRLDSIGPIGGSIGVVTQQDVDTNLIGHSLVFSFGVDFSISSIYAAIEGKGKYSLEQGNVILVDNFRRVDESGALSEWFNVAASAINDAESYSIIDNKLSIFYQGNSKQMHFTKL